MVASKQKQQKRPFGLLRVGFKYEKTLGMRRLTNTPIAVVLWEEGDLLILCRGEGPVLRAQTVVRRRGQGRFQS